MLKMRSWISCSVSVDGHPNDGHIFTYSPNCIHITDNFSKILPASKNGRTCLTHQHHQKKKKKQIRMNIFSATEQRIKRRHKWIWNENNTKSTQRRRREKKPPTEWIIMGTTTRSQTKPKRVVDMKRPKFSLAEQRNWKIRYFNFKLVFVYVVRERVCVAHSIVSRWLHTLTDTLFRHTIVLSEKYCAAVDWNYRCQINQCYGVIFSTSMRPPVHRTIRTINIIIFQPMEWMKFNGQNKGNQIKRRSETAREREREMNAGKIIIFTKSGHKNIEIGLLCAFWFHLA